MKMQVPVIAIDSLAYGRTTIVPWNIIKYDIFGGSSRGPDLYGTEPTHFYLANLLLNFNILTPLALLSLPALAQEQRAMAPEDLATLTRVAAPAVSPDGSKAAWQQTETDPAAYVRSTGI